jgi:hypothetical protein
VMLSLLRKQHVVRIEEEATGKPLPVAA